MPPRVVKRGAAAKRASRGSSKAAPDNQREPETAEVEAKNHAENSAVDVGMEEKHFDVDQELPEAPNGSAKVENNEEEVKESIDEYEKGEHLDLEDNYPEYEAEDYGGVDYDEKEIEQDGQDEADEVEEEPEEIIGDEEGDTGDEEVEYVYEEVEDDDDGEHVGEEHEHAQVPDVVEEEHRKVVKERRKRKEFEVFVGGLDKNATEHDLKKVFSKVGVVTEVRLMINPQTRRNKGFAFLRFETVEQAKRAVVELKNPVINGKQCGVTPSQDSDTLYLGNICKTWKKEALKEKLKHYGVENVEDLTLVEDDTNEGMNRGFAFLEFSSRSDAKEAYRRLQKRDVVFGVDKPAKVSFADSFIDLGDEIMAQVKTVFIDSLPPSWDEDYVRDLLKKYGEIEKIELARNMPAARRKNYGFVTFSTHAAAVECADSITSAGLGEGDRKAKVRARLSRPLSKPLQRGHGKHNNHGTDFRSRNSGRLARPSRGRPAPSSYPTRVVRGIGSRAPPVRPVSVRSRRPVTSMLERDRPVAPPARTFERRLTAPAYSKSGMKRDYSRREDLLPPRSRVAADYGSRIASQRHTSYRDYPARGSDYPELHRSSSRAAPKRGYVDDGYGQRFERPPPPHLSYREGRPRDYESIAGSKRPYTAIDDVPPRYDTGARQSRSRLDYEYGSSAPQYGDAYRDRLARSSLGYSGSRTSISSQELHGTYGSRQGISYGGGSFGGSDGGMYTSSYGGDYESRGSDVGGRSYSSMYSGRGVGGGSSSYMGGGGGSGSYY
ncbi:nucleolin [Vigna radiata var. radiata]|uniref:Nucleolin n=1 Tax=Vigna radiata var. radiata TaxID=3916 RepID=A0A1S3TVZ0_VIGRR|nr:nucleolin [Vigna radiata var. radiata]XP_022635672.1 nucleolin [Vigna radiata var. radiata]